MGDEYKTDGLLATKLENCREDWPICPRADCLSRNGLIELYMYLCVCVFMGVGGFLSFVMLVIRVFRCTVFTFQNRRFIRIDNLDEFYSF